MKPRVVVIGAGLGGLSAAIHLASRGMEVEVFEKNERVGGKQLTLSMKGYMGERWPTGGLPAGLYPHVRDEPDL